MLLGRAQRAEERADYRTGIIAATVANAFRSKKGKAFSPEDFMPRQQRRKAVQPKTAEEMLAIVEMLNVAFGGEDKRGDRDSAAIRNSR